MFDIKTVFLVGMALSTIEFLIALLIWLNHRQLAGIREIVGCYLLLPVAYGVAILLRSEGWIILGNAGLHLALSLYAVGTARLFKRTRDHAWLIPASFFGTMLLWKIFFMIDPNNVLIRIYAVEIFDTAVSSWILVMILQNPQLPKALQGFCSAALLFHVGAHIVRTVLSHSIPNDVLIQRPSPAWYILVNNLYANLMFFFVILIIARQIADSFQLENRQALVGVVNDDMPQSLSPTTNALMSASSESATTTLQDAAPDNDNWILNQIEWSLRSPEGVSMQLTAAEYGLLELFGDVDMGAALSREDIFSRLPRNLLNNASNLDALVRRVRKKVQDNAGRTIPIKTVYGVGYAFTAPLSINT